MGPASRGPGREPGAAVCVCGDGATSNGAFYEAINYAGVWRVPAVFVVNNNQWAISMPREEIRSAYIPPRSAALEESG